MSARAGSGLAWLCAALLVAAAVALLARESAAAVALAAGAAPGLGFGALLLALLGSAVAAVYLVVMRGREGALFRALLLAVAVLVALLAWLLEYRVVEHTRVSLPEGGPQASLLAPRGAGPYPAALVLPSAEGADAREARLLARYLAERGVVALATDGPLPEGSMAQARQLFERLVDDPRVDELRAGLVCVGEAASAAITEVELATFLVIAGVEGAPEYAHWNQVHVPLLLLAGGRDDTATAEARLDAVGTQLTDMTQAETDALLLADGDLKLRRSPLRFAQGYPRVVPGWIHLIFRLPGEDAAPPMSTGSRSTRRPPGRARWPAAASASAAG